MSKLNLKTKKLNQIKYLKNNYILNYIIEQINIEYGSNLKIDEIDFEDLLLNQDRMTLSQLNDFELVLIRLDIHFEDLLFDFNYVSKFS